MSDTDHVKGERPQYKLTESAYIDDVLYVAGDTINYTGIPGHHMEAINGSAKAMKAKHPAKYLDPIISMTAITQQA